MDDRDLFNAQQQLIDVHAALRRQRTGHGSGKTQGSTMPFVSLVPPRVSFSELQQYPEDGPRYELYDGELVELAAPIPLHQLVVLRTCEVLREYERAHGGLVLFTPIDVVLDEFNVLQPDLLFFSAERRSLIDFKQAIRVSPDLVVEVSSPSTARRDRGRKLRLYAQYGVREHWLVDPEAQSIEIRVLGEGEWRAAVHARPGAQVESSILEGLRVDPVRLFDGL
jgi:Uma2 family endonuclease